MIFVSFYSFLVPWGEAVHVTLTNYWKGPMLNVGLEDFSFQLFNLRVS